ncbi:MULTISPECIES: 8-oxoguanine DNA glycosylase OGG fold protein [unclassified Mycolicibacterium]|uniref:8-oxoguanine DNA glycosylase OGG fold protein n=1 Tax=unclassified Mycolicibacterium TaxID=2636767 RepID=UPI002EDB9A2D
MVSPVQWTRIDGLGPAFFTKFLYFTTPGALILDKVLARKVHSLCGMTHLVDSRDARYLLVPLMTRSPMTSFTHALRMLPLPV